MKWFIKISTMTEKTRRQLKFCHSFRTEEEKMQVKKDSVT